MSRSICFRSATELASQIKDEFLTSPELIDACLDRIRRHNGRLNAFRTVFDDRARERAHALQEMVDRGDDTGPLHGVPVAIKDNIAVAGESATVGLRPLLDVTADQNQTVVDRLQDAGAVVVGITRMPELGLATTDNSWTDPTSTPFDPDRNAGGSSGGSASAVAAGMVPIALGTDGGGSIRIPSSFSGTYGVKPTFRRVPRAGRPNAFGSVAPFSEIGPIARTVKDAALVLHVISGPDPRDPFVLPDDETDYVGSIASPLDDLTVAFSPDLGVFAVDERVRAVGEDVVDAFEACGMTVEAVSPQFDRPRSEILDVWYTWAELGYAETAELTKQSTGVDMLGDRRDELHPKMVEMMERGQEYSALEVNLLNVIRTEVFDAIEDVFASGYDVLVAPTLSVPPVENSAEEYTTGPSEVDGEPVDPCMGWCLTYPINLSGHPASSVPAGLTDDGLPVGYQIIGPKFDDDIVLAASKAFETQHPWIETYDAIDLEE
jgi:amidase/aspartyl-tRNA(Asn)/glutamyl-tRNA(Gln) amidotransferase subunit A